MENATICNKLIHLFENLCIDTHQLNKSKMPDASTQTTKGKKIKLIKKPVSVQKLVKVWFDKTYKDWWPWNMCLDMCEKEFGISINAESNSDISDYLYTLYKENQPDDSSDEEDEEKCCNCGTDEENEEICCKCGTDEEVNQCWECDRYICIDCDSNEMACYGEEDHTYCQLCGEAVLIDEDNFSEDDEYEERKEEAKQYREQVAEEIEYERKRSTARAIEGVVKRSAEMMIQEKFGSLSGIKVSCNF